jgi:hypothetical protein
MEAMAQYLTLIQLRARSAWLGGRSATPAIIIFALNTANEADPEQSEEGLATLTRKAQVVIQ